MNKLLLQIILLFVGSYQLAAQDRLLTITGKLLDAKNTKPLAFASIYLKDTAIGTVSNIEGSFVFHVPAEFAKDTIIISLLGYTSIRKAVTDFAEDSH